MINIISTSTFTIPKEESSKNQDSILLPKKLDDYLIFAIADGVGKYEGAKIASSIAIEHIQEISNISELSDMKLVFEIIKTKLINRANIDKKMSKMATTLTICIINEDTLRIGHTGDCRVYTNEENQLKQQTTDQTEHQKLIDEGSFTREELKNHNRKNVLSSALSPTMDVVIEEKKIPLESQQIYLMSDGAYHFLENSFQNKPKKNNISEFCSNLENHIRKLSPNDDSSLIAVMIE